jgi:HK97 family phage major capsid protein
MIEFTSKEQRDYSKSLGVSIFDLGNNRKPDGLAVEISRTLSMLNPQFGSHPDGLLVPLQMLATRGLNVTNWTSGGALLADNVSEEIERVLRVPSACIAAGTRVLAGLVGDVKMGRELAEVSVSWLHESETLSATDSQFGAVNLTGHRCSGMTTLNKQLKIQSTPDIFSFIQDSIFRGIGSAADRAIIQGSGFLGEPLGIFHTQNVATVTFGGPATWSKLLNFIRQIADNNADDSAISFLATPAVREKFMQTQRWPAGVSVSTALWDDDDRVAGKPARVTRNCPDNSIVCGDFSKSIFGIFGEAIQLVIDPFTQKRQGVIEIYLSLYGDVGIIRENVFCINSDSALQ